MWDLSTLTGDRTCVPCIGRWSLNHRTPRKSQRTLPDSVLFSPVAQLCPILFNPIDYSTSGFPVHHQLPEPAQTHVHRVGDAIQPSYPLSSPSPPAFNLSQHQGFSSESALSIRWPKYFTFSISPFNEHSWFRCCLLSALISVADKLECSRSRGSQIMTVNGMTHISLLLWPMVLLATYLPRDKWQRRLTLAGWVTWSIWLCQAFIVVGDFCVLLMLIQKFLCFSPLLIVHRCFYSRPPWLFKNELIN